MALGLPGSSNGDMLAICTWDARAGRMFKVERTQGPMGWQSDKIDVTNEQPTFMLDVGSLTVGWIAFLPTGPNFEMVPLGTPLPAKPSADHKAGFRVKLLSPKHFGGLREFSSSAKSVLSALDALHSAYEAAPEAAAGQMPIVQLKGSTSIVTKGPSGNVTSYSPSFAIVAWQDRPADVLGARTVPAPGASQTGAPAPVHTAPAPSAPPPNHVPPPHVTAQVPENAKPAGMPEW